MGSQTWISYLSALGSRMRESIADVMPQAYLCRTRRGEIGVNDW